MGIQGRQGKEGAGEGLDTGYLGQGVCGVGWRRTWTFVNICVSWRVDTRMEREKTCDQMGRWGRAKALVGGSIFSSIKWR